MRVRAGHGRNRATSGAHTGRAHQVVAVIGAGASGILTARALLRSGRPRTVVLIERDQSWSTGPAYSTTQPCHLLNVRASHLSADTSDPDDFVKWARARGVNAHDDAFLPRRLFGEYLRASLDAAVASAPESTLTRVTDRVVRVVPSALGVQLDLEGGQSFNVDHVVLAMGNPPPRAIGAREPRLIEDPWSPDALDDIEADDPVVLIGTGLTAVDVALQLFAQGRRAPVEMLSRHGLLPRAHAPRTHPTGARANPIAPITAPRTARAALRAFRSAVEAVDGDWRAVLDAVRPHINELWAALPEVERARLLRHVARLWDVHRHRMAPEVATRVSELVRAGRIRVERGDFADRRPAAGTWIVNCTGPNFDLRASADPLIRDLLTTGRARPGRCGQGLDSTPAGQLVDVFGAASAQISAIGPLRRGTAWETTAIPEIRCLAHELADRLDLLDGGTHRATRMSALRVSDRVPAPAVSTAFFEEAAIDEEQLREMLRTFTERTDFDTLAARLPTAPGLRSWTRVAATDTADAWLIAWGATSEVRAHDHGGSRGAVRVLLGSLVESYRDPVSRGRWQRRAIGTGQTIELPTTHVHSVSNSGLGPALSLHVYSPPLAAMNFVPPARPVEVCA